MKIEIGESLLYSWLRHAKGCQLVQTNWKASPNSWELRNEEVLQKLMVDSSNLFGSKYNYQIYKSTTSLSQLLQQAEVDVLGVSFEDSSQFLYAIDVAFHEAGLNYGSKDETVTRVIKKTLRSAMCLYGYFDINIGDVIFASPKINKSVISAIMECVPDIEHLLHLAGLNYNIRILCNDDFDEKIIQPVIAATALIADTSELFVRSMQMYNLFSSTKKKPIVKGLPKNIPASMPDTIEVTNIDGFNEMKIGVLVRSTLTKMLSNHEITKEEIAFMQTTDYSKQTFDIQYPLLIKASLSNGQKVPRYWAGAVEAYGEKYFICSEWFEVPQNNDRPYFMKWLALHKKNNS